MQFILKDSGEENQVFELDCMRIHINKLIDHKMELIKIKPVEVEKIYI